MRVLAAILVLASFALSAHPDYDVISSEENSVLDYSTDSKGHQAVVKGNEGDYPDEYNGLENLDESDPSKWPQSLLDFYNSTGEDYFDTISANDLTPGDGKISNLQSRFFTLIFPGTRWCGPGNIASSESDLGVFAAADTCCRTHDHCPDYISAMSANHGLTNIDPTTKLTCDCDTAFYNCLKAVNSLVSNKLGSIYFNLVGNDCFKEDFPITGCKTYSFFGTRCLEYILDTTQPKKFQWFNNPLY